ncbi:MAG: dihydroneopterin aldolase [Bacteroides sp.]|nr:dihydroneopterin aldolase [Bacteroides sp.]
MHIQKSHILLEDLRFYAYHGVSPQEQQIGNEYSVYLELGMDLSKAAESDTLADTVSYAEVAETVKKEMDIPSLLLEHVCGRIVKHLFQHFPLLQEIRIKLYKRNPPMGTDIQRAGVSMSCSRHL